MIDVPALERSVQRSLPQFALGELRLAPLAGGITNRNYTFSHNGSTYVVRVPGEQTELLGIDRAHEVEAATRAASLGIGPPVIGLLDGIGTVITQLVNGRHEEGSAFERRVTDVVELLRRLHNSGPLAGAFPIHRIVEAHANDASTRGVALPARYDELLSVSHRIEEAFA